MSDEDSEESNTSNFHSAKGVNNNKTLGVFDAIQEA
jgi:hypothetical protein